MVAALAGERVLLVDADLRRPRLHTLFGIPIECGFADLLEGRAAFADVARPFDLGADAVRLKLSTGKEFGLFQVENATLIGGPSDNVLDASALTVNAALQPRINLTLIGGEGKDILKGSFGNDILMGGLGNVWGALTGALIFGLTQSLGILIWPQFGIVFPYAAVVVVLLFRPRGLLKSTW